MRVRMCSACVCVRACVRVEGENSNKVLRITGFNHIILMSMIL